jgi:NitT/TauT family transport system permease protein
VIIPSALTWIFASLHTSFSFALVGAVVGEFVGAIQGIGLLIQNAGSNFNPNGVFAAMVILAVVALLSELLITTLERRLLRWRPNPVADVTI